MDKMHGAKRGGLNKPALDTVQEVHVFSIKIYFSVISFKRTLCYTPDWFLSSVVIFIPRLMKEIKTLLHPPVINYRFGTSFTTF